MDKALQDIKNRYLPKVKQMLRLEQENRVFALVPLTMICGLRVEQFKPKHWITLESVDNPFVVKNEEKELLIGHIVEFLWIVSPGYKMLEQPPKEFYKTVGKLPLLKSCCEIEDYMQKAMMDLNSIATVADDKNKAEPKRLTYWLTTYFDYFSDWEKLLDTPFAVLAQIVRNRLIKSSVDHGVVNPSDQFISQMNTEVAKLKKTRRELLGAISKKAG